MLRTSAHGFTFRLYRDFRGTNAAYTVFKAAGAAEHGGLVPRSSVFLDVGDVLGHGDIMGLSHNISMNWKLIRMEHMS